MLVEILLGALLPIFGLILAGFLCSRFDFPGSAFWPAAERLTYFLLFPALLIKSTATASLQAVNLLPLLTALALSVFVAVIILFLLRPRLGSDRKAFSSLFQGCIRFNTYVGFAVAYALFGNEGLSLASVTIALLIPLVNLLSVSVLVYSNQDNPNWTTLSLTILKTPPFLACLVGISMNSAGIELPGVMLEFLALFGRASLPLGLLAVGACLQVSSFASQKALTFIAVAFKLVALPGIMFFFCHILGVHDTARVIVVLFAALPGSASSYILSRQLGGDSTLMANIVTMQIVLSTISLPVVLFFLL
jgi:predicted permease